MASASTVATEKFTCTGCEHVFVQRWRLTRHSKTWKMIRLPGVSGKVVENTQWLVLHQEELRMLRLRVKKLESMMEVMQALCTVPDRASPPPSSSSSSSSRGKGIKAKRVRTKLEGFPVHELPDDVLYKACAH